MSALLHFDVGEEHGGGGGRDGNGTGFGSADSVEDFGLVAGDENAFHGREWSADDVDAAHEFVGPVIRENTPHHDGQNLERLGHSALRERESALNVLKIQTVRLPLFLDFVFEFL